MLSRKYYKAIAEILNKRYKAKENQDGTTTLNQRADELNFITRELISLFQADNIRFSEQRFLSAVNQK